VTARLPKETLEEIEAIAERERIDRSELIRRLLDVALAKRRIDEAVEAYRSGKVTLWRASEMARVFGVRCLGTVGVLLLGLAEGLLGLGEFVECLDVLIGLGFRLSVEVYRKALACHFWI